MKLSQVIPPVLSLLIAIVWLTNLRRSTDIVKRENAEIRERFSSPRKSSFSRENRTDARLNTVRSGVRPRREKKTPDNADNPAGDWVATSRDWKRLVLSNNDEPVNRLYFTPAWDRLEALAVEMNGDELTSAYLEMATLPINAPFRYFLEKRMLVELQRKNPEFAFSQYIEKTQDDENRYTFFSFDDWVKRDPAAAMNWYESQIAAGTFDKSLDGKSSSKAAFESALVMTLLTSDPAAAEQRMSMIPPVLRGRVGAFVDGVPKEKKNLVVDLLRKTMPVEDYMAMLRGTNVFDCNFSGEFDSDPENAKKSLETFAITAEERSVLLANQFVDFAQYRAMRVSNGGDPRRKEFDKNRKWIQEVDPSAADRATGIALQAFVKGVNSPESYDFVEKTANDYLGSGAGDELLVPLIEGSANGSSTYPKDRARELAAKISDAALRNELLQKLN